MTNSPGNLTLRCSRQRCQSTFTYPRSMDRERALAFAAQQGWTEGKGFFTGSVYCGHHPAPSPR